MAQTIKKMPNEPIIVAKFTEPFDVVADTSVVAARLQDALSSGSDNVYYIADMSEIKIQFSDLVSGLAQAYADKSSPYSNPRLKTFTVARDELIALGAKAAAEQKQYGNAAVQFYASVDEALAEVRQHIKQG